MRRARFTGYPWRRLRLPIGRPHHTNKVTFLFRLRAGNFMSALGRTGAARFCGTGPIPPKINAGANSDPFCRGHRAHTSRLRLSAKGTTPPLATIYGRTQFSRLALENRPCLHHTAIDQSDRRQWYLGCYGTSGIGPEARAAGVSASMACSIFSASQACIGDIRLRSKAAR